MGSAVQTMVYMPDPPLRIEREYSISGHEFILIEGVRYDASYFRTFAHPDTDVLFAVRRDGDTVVLSIIRNAQEAAKFFEEIGRGNPAPTEEVSDGL